MSKITRRHFVGSVGAAAGVAVVGSGSASATGSSELAFMSATDLATRVRQKEISSVELTQYFIDRIERIDADVNAVVVRDFDRAMSTARSADNAQANGQALGPFHGLPMTVKESYDIAGLPTTWGVPAFIKNIAGTDSAVVQAMKSAGATYLGKTNVPVMLGDFQAYNDIYGKTSNPWDLERVPGGSSGGSAAALAAGLTALDCGSDIGGSIRNPASFCGVYGHKPTWGIVKSAGHSLPIMLGEPDLAVCGPMARAAEDLAQSMALVTGPDALNAPGWRLELPPPRSSTLRGMRIAFWPTDANSPVDDELVERQNELAGVLSLLGAKVSDSARPDYPIKEAHLAYQNLVVAITQIDVPLSDYQKNMEIANSIPSDDMSQGAVWARAAVQNHREWRKSEKMRTHVRMRWQQFFQDWDIVVCPIMATTAFKHDHSPMEQRTISVNGQQRPYWEQIFWAGLGNLGGLPGTVFPAGLSKSGMPMGFQALGAEFDDYTTIEFTRLLAREIGGFKPPPTYGR